MPWWTPRFRKRSLDSQLDDELSFHVEELINEKIAEGLSPEEARRQAILDFGGREQMKEELRDVHRIAVVEDTAANLKSAFRLMAKAPSFSFTIILTLALCIGGNSAVFSAIDAILLRPLPFPDADRLMVLREHKPKSPNNPQTAPVRLEEWNRNNSTFQAITGYYAEVASETTGELPERVTRAIVAPRFLQVLGISPSLGRGFRSEEEQFGGPAAVLISDRFWRQRFDADPSAVGKVLRVDDYSFPIIGVMPAWFRLFEDVDAWSPVHVPPALAQNRKLTWYRTIGRLKPGVTQQQAREDLARVQAQLGEQYLEDAELRVEVEALKEMTVGEVRSSLWLLFGSVSLLLLIACTNIAALLLARATDREREIWIRFSLGASRRRVVAQLLTEAFVLALTGAVLGLAVAAGAVNVLRTLASDLPRMEEIVLDWRIVVYSLGCAAVVTLLCGLLPAIRGTRRTIAGALAGSSRAQVSTRNPLQWLLVGMQVALAATLLVGAGLLLRSFDALALVAPGFDPRQVLALRISANWGETGDMNALQERFDRTLEALRAVPGVESAAASLMLPGLPSRYQTEVKLMESGADPEATITANTRLVTSGYFETMRIPIVAGEPCRESLGSTALVNRSFVDNYLGGAAAIGRHVAMTSMQAIPPAEIRGVAGNARESGISQEPGPIVYWCLNKDSANPHPFFLVRTHGEPLALAETLRRKVREIEPARSVFGIKTLEDYLYDSFHEERLRAVLLALFALTAVSLASVGLYGTLSYFVSVRRREVGLRLALGALRGQVVTRFLLRGLGVTLVGCLAGLGLAAVSARVLSGMLFGVTRWDPVTYLGVVLVVVVVATAASLVPAVRAARVEPMRVLREE